VSTDSPPLLAWQGQTLGMLQEGAGIFLWDLPSESGDASGIDRSAC